MAQFVLCSHPIVKDPNHNTDAENVIINIDIVRSVYVGTATPPWYGDEYPAVTFVYPNKDDPDVTWFYENTLEGTKLRDRDFQNVLRVGKLVNLGMS